MCGSILSTMVMQACFINWIVICKKRMRFHFSLILSIPSWPKETECDTDLMKECDKESGFEEGMWQSIVWPDAIIWQWCDLMKEFEFDLRQNVTWWRNVIRVWCVMTQNSPWFLWWDFSPDRVHLLQTLALKQDIKKLQCFIVTQDNFPC